MPVCVYMRTCFSMPALTRMGVFVLVCRSDSVCVFMLAWLFGCVCFYNWLLGKG